MPYRIEKDSLGEVQVPADKLWGAQTQRACQNFCIGEERMPTPIIHAIATVKNAAAQANCECGTLPPDKAELISRCCELILQGKLDNHFPLHVWQTGSGTQTNMNVNEVVSNWAEIEKHGRIDGFVRYVHPNDDVNKSQSTNDVFPSALRIAAALQVDQHLLPALRELMSTLNLKSKEFADIIKIGRTHLMDATPITLGQEFSGYADQIRHDIESIEMALKHAMELPIGGTAVGTGLNTPKGYTEAVIRHINALTKLTFTPSDNRFEAMASHDSLSELSASFRRCAISLMKIANDFRLLGSGPRCGIGELQLPTNEPGSSIMPGKVNPTQCEALTMVCAQVIGNDTAITIGAMQGHLELNVFMPLIGRNIMESIVLLTDAVNSFNAHCVSGVQPCKEMIQKNLDHSLMLVTALNPHIGYAKAAEIAQHAHREHTTLKGAAVTLGYVSEADFDAWVSPEKMVGQNNISK